MGDNKPLLGSSSMNRGFAADQLLNGLCAYPSLLVKQKPKGWFLELCCGWESENLYKIYDPHSGNSHILTATEESDWLTRNCCGTVRPFDMPIRTITGEEICRFERPLHLRRGGLCCCCCGDYFFQMIRVYSGAGSSNPGELLGWVKEDYSVCLPVFHVMRSEDDIAFTIIGNCCGCTGYHLDIYEAHKGDHDQPVGSIEKMWSGLGKELFTDADNFFVTFPVKATGQDRALLLAALFLIDFLFFENNQRNNS